MSTILDYKCPACGGRAEFDSNTQMMKCPFCDTTFDVEELEEQDQVLDQEPAEESPPKPEWEEENQQWDESEAEQMQVYTCKSCGGELVTDRNTVATHCPYCDNPVVLAGRLSGQLKPDLVIPFQLDKEYAKNALRKHCSGKKLLPKSFYSESRLEEIKGIYVPFWLFDSDVDADIRYQATKVRSWSDSNYIYTETSYYDVAREGSLSFCRIPVDGSSKMADDLMESIEPFDSQKAVEFQTAYLSGYLADKYDVTSEDSKDRANHRLESSTKAVFRSSVSGYSSVNVTRSNIRTSNAKVKYALYPVWMLTTNWEGKRYIFAMNGQTGKFVGDLPMSKTAYWLWWALWAGILSVGALLILYILTRFGFL